MPGEREKRDDVVDLDELAGEGPRLPVQSEAKEKWANPWERTAAYNNYYPPNWRLLNWRRACCTREHQRARSASAFWTASDHLRLAICTLVRI
jgi:hypothetical protein